MRSCSLCHAFHGERNAAAPEVDVSDANADMLVEADNIHRMADASVGELRNVDEAILMDADVYEGTEVCDVCDDAGQLHAFAQVVDGTDVSVELERFERLAWVAAGFLQFVHDVSKSGQAHFGAYVLIDFDART